MFIKDYIVHHLDEGVSSKDLANKLGISISMLTAYKLHNYNASLEVAKRVYLVDGVVLHPFSEEALKYEVNKGETNE